MDLSKYVIQTSDNIANEGLFSKFKEKIKAKRDNSKWIKCEEFMAKNWEAICNSKGSNGPYEYVLDPTNSSEEMDYVLGYAEKVKKSAVEHGIRFGFSTTPDSPWLPGPVTGGYLYAKDPKVVLAYGPVIIIFNKPLSDIIACKVDAFTATLLLNIRWESKNPDFIDTNLSKRELVEIWTMRFHK